MRTAYCLLIAVFGFASFGYAQASDTDQAKNLLQTLFQAAMDRERKLVCCTREQAINRFYRIFERIDATKARRDEVLIRTIAGDLVDSNATDTVVTVSDHLVEALAPKDIALISEVLSGGLPSSARTSEFANALGAQCSSLALVRSQTTHDTIDVFFDLHADQMREVGWLLDDERDLRRSLAQAIPFSPGHGVSDCEAMFGY